MSDIKKIKDEFLLRLNENLDLNQINEIKSDLFGKNGLVSSQFKKLGSVAESDRKIFASDLNTVKEELQSKILQKIKNRCSSHYCYNKTGRSIWATTIFINTNQIKQIYS